MLRWLMKKLHAPIYKRRIEELVHQITPHLQQGDLILDVGCGFGALGRAILDSPLSPHDIEVFGLERLKRDVELIPVEVYDGLRIPRADDSVDVVVLADVLHHERDPHPLIAECHRVSRRLLIIKDHKLEGFLAKPRVQLIDWAANVPYGMPSFYRYNTLREWREWIDRHGVTVVRELVTMRLYPPLLNLLFGRRLQYFVVLATQQDKEGAALM
jgi:SAM-dependent methyltransferase